MLEPRFPLMDTDSEVGAAYPSALPAKKPCCVVRWPFPCVAMPDSYCNPVGGQAAGAVLPRNPQFPEPCSFTDHVTYKPCDIQRLSTGLQRAVEFGAAGFAPGGKAPTGSPVALGAQLQQDPTKGSAENTWKLWGITSAVILVLLLGAILGALVLRCTNCEKRGHTTSMNDNRERRMSWQQDDGKSRINKTSACSEANAEELGALPVVSVVELKPGHHSSAASENFVS